MDDLRRVRKRIRGRRFDGAGAQEQKQRPFILFRMIYHAVMLMMCICVVVLALLLNQKLNLVKMPAGLQGLSDRCGFGLEKPGCYAGVGKPCNL